MRILVTTFGTRGDVQPYAALAGALTARGHEVTLAAPEAFRDLVEPTGAALHPAGSRMLTMLRDVMPELSGARDALRTLGVMREAMREHIDEQWAAAQACEPELVVHHPKCLAGPHIAERLGVPGVLSIPLPFYSPTRAFPVPFLATAALPGWANRATFAFTRMGTVMYGGMINDFRRRVGLPRIGRFADPLRNPDGTPVTVVYPYSRHVVPVPADFPSTVHVTGYWFLSSDPAWQPPAALTDFLDAGPAPVYVGFGSMGFGRGADARRDAILGALRANGLRGVVATGWGGIDSAGIEGDDVLAVDDVPHEWLFERVAAVVHHGGAGSTAAALRAGKPSLICPFVGDQPFWGARVHAAGAGPAPLKAGRLTCGALTARLHELAHDEGYRVRADGLGRRIRFEDGLATACDVLERSVPA